MALLAPTPKREERLAGIDRAILIRRLKAFSQQSRIGESDRQARDRKGSKLFRGQMWEDGITAGRLAITSNIVLALYERKCASITRNDPTVELEAIDSDNDDAASLLQGALVTNWRTRRMRMKMKVGQRLCGFTRPILHYVFWDRDLRDGIGDMNDRIIPAHRCIIDDRFDHVSEMEFKGFRERMTRAKLIQLFPDKADEIERAAYSTKGGANVGTSVQVGNTDPLRPSQQGGGTAVLDRLVADSPAGPFTGVTSIRVGGTKRQMDPLSEEVDVEFLWFEDPTPIRVQRPRKNALGQLVHELVRHPETGEIQFDSDGHDVVDTAYGPIMQPKLTPRRRVVMEDAIVRKYRNCRHVCWLPNDSIDLWDVDWRGPVPLYTQRDSYALSGYWSEGSALRCASLAIAYNILDSIIFERLKLSLSGTWLATYNSGLKKNKLTPEDGQVFQVQNLDGIKQFPVTPLDSAYFNLLNILEQQMMKLIGVSEVQQGAAAGRADSPATYDKLTEQAGVTIGDAIQLLEESIREWADIAMWFVQNYYTHEHFVEVEAGDGTTSWRAASALSVRGKYAVNVDAAPMLAYSDSAMWARAKELNAMHIYALPMMCKVGRVPHWKAALRQIEEIQKAGPSKAYLLGAAGSPPAQASKVVQTQGRRSHHAPGR